MSAMDATIARICLYISTRVDASAAPKDFAVSMKSPLSKRLENDLDANNQMIHDNTDNNTMRMNPDVTALKLRR